MKTKQVVMISQEGVPEKKAFEHPNIVRCTRTIPESIKGNILIQSYVTTQGKGTRNEKRFLLTPDEAYLLMKSLDYYFKDATQNRNGKDLPSVYGSLVDDNDLSASFGTITPDYGEE